MEDKIIDKLRKFGALEPDNEYMEASKSIIMMKNDASFNLPIEKKIAEKISLLRSIEPDTNYTLASRMAIIESINLSKQSFWKLFYPANIFKNSLNYTMSVSLAIVLLAVMITGAYKFVSPVPIVADLDNNSLITEANSISRDIDIHLEEIDFYKKSAEKTAVALNEAYHGGPGHINNYVIQKEAGNIDFNNPGNSEIDELLQSAIF